MRSICILLLFCTSLNFGHEFIQKRRAPKVSLNKVKQEAADILSLQLRLSAEIMQQIGHIQITMQSKNITFDLKHESDQLKMIGNQLHMYSLQLVDLLQPMTSVQSMRFTPDMSLSLGLSHIVNSMGVIQQHIIKHLEDIFENKGCLFIRKYTLQLSDVVKTIKIYNDQFHALKKMLHALEKKLLPVHKSKEKQRALSCEEHVKKA
ncbi:MAG: hypothetical protein WD055_02940 [Candidatus Dependentiae bacterium]